jgi:CRP/FNR family transcriptional regulator
METDRVAAILRTDLFGGLTDSEAGALSERAIELHLAKDEVLFVEGEEARGLFVVVSGAVRAFRESLEGREQVIHVERAGATVAEVPVFDGMSYPSTVAGDEDSMLLFIEKKDVWRACREHPAVALAALKVLAGRLRRCAELVEQLALYEVDKRLAQLILSDGRARGTRTGAGLTFELTLTHQQIAARIGTVREVVSRALARLQQSGLLEVTGRTVTIPREDAFASFASE